MPSSRFAPTFALLLPLSLLSCASNGSGGMAASPAETMSSRTFGFDDGTGSHPEGWHLGTSNRRQGSDDAIWKRRGEATAPSRPNVLALTDARGHVGQAFNLCWTSEIVLDDVDIEVDVYAGGGREDQGGGPAWRIAGENDYYTARWNPLEDNFRVYSVQDGERLQLDSARVQADPRAWHTIRVRHVGDTITCWLDGVELLHAVDSKLPEAGGVGLWTKADATAWFDDLTVGPAGLTR